MQRGGPRRLVLRALLWLALGLMLAAAQGATLVHAVSHAADALDNARVHSLKLPTSPCDGCALLTPTLGAASDSQPTFLHVVAVRDRSGLAWTDPSTAALFAYLSRGPPTALR